MFRYGTREAEEVEVLEADVDVNGNRANLLVYNDDVNTFEWVIRCLMEILNHTSQQAEQLSLIIHFKGKAIVKSGAKPELKPLKDALVDRGLSAVIEEEGSDDN
jgi:ATP-dependent Clp protease adaptor protein ClpS